MSDNILTLQLIAQNPGNTVAELQSQVKNLAQILLSFIEFEQGRDIGAEAVEALARAKSRS